jgi:hypothetical protein
MSCRRVRRDLVDRFRFGEVDGCSSGHLDHLDGCAGCREEIGIDQALVRQLRRALHARVAGRSASPNAFAEIRRRALAETSPAFVGTPPPPGTSRWERLISWRAPLRMLAAGTALVFIAVVSTGQLNDLNRGAQLAASSVRWQGLVETASLPALEPWKMHRALGVPPPPRPSGLTREADAVGVVAIAPPLTEPEATRFFQ